MKEEQMNNKRKIAMYFVAVLIIFVMAGCAENQASVASRNISQEADNFNVIRQVTVFNNITHETLIQITGKISVTYDPDDHQLEILIENEDGQYSKDIIGLNEVTTYTVHQVGGFTTSPYNYQINFNPKLLIPLEPAVID
jgi:hypothetical protein